MKRTLIRLTENDLHAIIRESVERAMVEEGVGSWLKNQVTNLANWNMERSLKNGDKAATNLIMNDENASKETILGYLQKYGEYLEELQAKGDSDGYKKVRSEMMKLYGKYKQFLYQEFEERYRQNEEQLQNQYKSLTTQQLNQVMQNWVSNEMNNAQNVYQDEDLKMYTDFLKKKLGQLKQAENGETQQNTPKYAPNDFRRYLK